VVDQGSEARILPKLPAVLAATGPFFPYPLDELLGMFAVSGFDGVEIMVTTERETQDATALLALTRRHGLSIPVIHGPFLLLTKGVFGTDPREKIARSVDLAVQVGARVVVIHAPYRWEVGYADWLPAEIARIHAERGVMVTVENMFPVQVGNLRVAFHSGTELDVMRRFHFITLDTSHAAVAGQDLLRAYRSVADKVVHVHASNNAGAGRDTHAPLEEGILPVGEFLEELIMRGYTGAVTLELNLRGLLEDRERLVEALRHNATLARIYMERGLRRAAVTPS
jgi:sugar phosphate isomerase/epimerase